MNDLKQLSIPGAVADPAHIEAAIKALGSVTLSTLTTEQLDQVAGFAQLQEAVKQLQTETLLARHDIDNLVDNWLGTFDSEHTRSSYSLNIQAFRAWLSENRLHILTAKTRDMDSYAAHCRAEYGAAKANLLINTVGSFYACLAKWEVRPTPCIKIKRAHNGYTQKRIPYQQEIEEMIKDAQANIATAIRILADVGLRVGSLSTLKVTRRSFAGISKGKRISGTLPVSVTTREALTMIEAAQAKAAFTRRINRHLYKHGWSAHDLRHAFAIKVYTDTGHDTEAVRRALGHSNLAVTTTYLQGLTVGQ